MYCSSCGVAVAQGLSYCNYCGAKLNQSNDAIKSPEVKPELLVSAMVGLFILGLGVITVLMGVMKSALELPVDRILALSLLPFLLMLVIEGVLLRLLFQRKRGAEDARDTLPKGQTTRELDAARARALQEPVASVTEHTTRAFDPIYSDRTTK